MTNKDETTTLEGVGSTDGLGKIKTAKEQFDAAFGETEENPLERLRFFCSIALNGQDWLDVEPFFDDVLANFAAEGGGTTGGLGVDLDAEDDAWASSVRAR